MIGSVVVLYNPKKEEIENINTYLLKVDYVEIIDNSCIDNEKMVNSLIFDLSKVEYYSEQRNMGLCKGFNIGVKKLKEKGCEWALLFDADSRLGSDIVSVYTEAIKKYNNKKVALFAPVHVFDRSLNSPYKGFKNVNWSMTSGWLINIDIFVKQDCFFEELFVDGLDMDYCFKCHENGYEVIECGEAVINHNPAETRMFFGLKYGIASPKRYYMQARQLIWCWKRYRKMEPLLIYLYKWMKIFILFTDKRAYINGMLKGRKEGYHIWKKYQTQKKI